METAVVVREGLRDFVAFKDFLGIIDAFVLALGQYLGSDFSIGVESYLAVNGGSNNPLICSGSS